MGQLKREEWSGARSDGDFTGGFYRPERWAYLGRRVLGSYFQWVCNGFPLISRRHYSYSANAATPVTPARPRYLPIFRSIIAFSFSLSSVTRHSAVSASRIHASPATRASCKAPRPTIPAPLEPAGRSSPWLGAPLPSVCGIVFASGALSEPTAIFDARTRARLALIPLWMVCPHQRQRQRQRPRP